MKKIFLLAIALTGFLSVNLNAALKNKENILKKINDQIKFTQEVLIKYTDVNTKFKKYKELLNQQENKNIKDLVESTADYVLEVNKSNLNEELSNTSKLLKEIVENIE